MLRIGKLGKLTSKQKLKKTAPINFVTSDGATVVTSDGEILTTSWPKKL